MSLVLFREYLTGYVLIILESSKMKTNLRGLIISFERKRKSRLKEYKLRSNGIGTPISHECGLTVVLLLYIS